MSKSGGKAFGIFNNMRKTIAQTKIDREVAENNASIRDRTDENDAKIPESFRDLASQILNFNQLLVVCVLFLAFHDCFLEKSN